MTTITELEKLLNELLSDVSEDISIQDAIKCLKAVPAICATVVEIRSALIRAKREAESLRVWNGTAYKFHPTQAKHCLYGCTRQNRGNQC